MTIDLRLPNITGTDSEKIAKIVQFLFQLVEQLNFVLNEIDTSVRNNASAPSKSEEEKTIESYGMIRSMLLNSTDFLEKVAINIRDL